jgi:predicted NBD/HSP70 family sugar kinase
MNSFNVGLDIGGQSIEVGTLLTNVPGWKGKYEFLHATFSIPINPSFHQAGLDVRKAIINKFGRLPSQVGACCFGPLDLENKTILNAPNMQSWIGQSFADWEDILEVPICLDNDANTAIFAEATIGAGRRHRIVAGFTLGSGIGFGLVINGQIHHGLWDTEAGHMILDPNGPLCGCGQRGCLESHISTTAISKRYSGLSPKELSGREEVWRYYATFLARGCHTIAVTINPEIILLCGGIAQEQNLVDYTNEYYKQMMKIYPESAKKPEIVRGILTPHSGMIGAVQLANSQ